MTEMQDAVALERDAKATGRLTKDIGEIKQG
jgi:hypothetical protein